MKSIHLPRFLMTIALLACATIGMAQTDRQFVRNGNSYYRGQNFVKAEAEYRKALSKNPDNPQALYNLGCALLMQKKDSLAMNQFDKATRLETSHMRKAMIYHNVGFLFQSHQMYAQAIKAYKESLRNNPSDDETRYNLELCKRLNKNNKNKQSQQNKQKQQQKQDKDKNNKDKNQNKDKEKQSPKQQNNEKMSKQNAEQLLNAAIQEENATRQRIKDAMRKGSTRKLEKNW